MRLIRCLMVLLAGLCIGSLARSQGFDVVKDNSDEKLLKCLIPDVASLPPLVYPAGALVEKVAALVRVKLEFSRPDQSPKSTVLFNVRSKEFEDQVLARVAFYRLPCLPETRTEPLVVTQEFNFDPTDGRPVIWGNFNPLGTGAGPRCELIDPVEPPNYPSRAGRTEMSRLISSSEASGALLALVKFTSFDSPPEIKIVHDAGSSQLASSVTDFLAQTRLKCDRYPVTGIRVFRFSMEGQPRYALKDMSLQTFAGMIDNLALTKEYFDFTSMGCPFEVDVRNYRPYIDNAVGEVGQPNPNRAAFLMWLRTVALKLPADAAKHLVGATTRVSVPCAVLDLRN